MTTTFPYKPHFIQGDSNVAFLDAIRTTETDGLKIQQLAGYLAISAAVTYEASIKDIIFEFCDKKNKILSHIGRNKFDKINSRIRLQQIKSDYLRFFGEKYEVRFKNKMLSAEKAHMTSFGRSASTSYGNLLVARNSFAHTGKIESQATYDELRTWYEDGKVIVKIFQESLRR